MPQFVKPPKGSPGAGAGYLDTATSTAKIPMSGGGGGGGGGGGNGGGTGSAPAPSGPTAAEKAKAEAKKRADARKKAAAAKASAKAAAEAAALNKYNPLATAFLSPSEIRQQAEDLAKLGSTSEEALRAQSAQQVAGIGGLTDALSSRLGAVNTQNVAGIAGMQRLYNDVAGQAQSAGTSAAAAAGVNPDTAPAAGASPMAVANMANLTAQTAGLVPAAGAIGLGLQAQAGSNLTKALVERSSRISSDTAKYLKQIQDQEYAKATGIETLKQNAKLLGIKADTAAGTAAYNDAKIQDMQNKQALGWANLDAKIAKINADAGKTGTAKAASIVDSILSSAATYTAPQKGLTGKQQFDVTWGNGKYHKKVFAKNAQGAAWLLRNQMGDADYKSKAWTANTTGKQEFALQLPSRAFVESQIRARLNNTTYTPAEIEAFLVTYAGALGLNTLPA